MRLAEFIDLYTEDILAEWEAFAVTRLPSAAKMDAIALRDHAPQILHAIAEDLRQSQSGDEQAAKSRGLAVVALDAPHTAAEVHGALRSQDGFSISQLVSEYRALRASVLRLWKHANGNLRAATAADDIIRFNEAVDQAIAESVDFFGRELSQERIAREEVDRALAFNRARLEYASRLSNVGFWYCDLPFDVLEWDDQVKEHFFLEPSARVTIEDFYDRIHPEDRELTRAAIATSIDGRQVYDIVYRTRHPGSGEVKWIRALGGTDYASDGSPIHFDGITVDVTVQKLGEQRLAESEARHRGVLANMGDAFALFDPDFNIIEVNDAACELIGLTRFEFIGANHWQKFPGTYDSDLGEMYRLVQLDGQSRSLEHHYRLAAGRAVWLEVRAFKVGNNVAVLFRNVTDRHEMIEALKNADKRKDEFLAMLAHELRNPLAPITTAGEILARVPTSDAPIAAAAAVIRRQASHMTRLIDDLLDVARVTQGRIQLQKTSVDIVDVVAQAFETCEPQLQAKQQRLTMSIDKSVPLYVDGDRARLVQCVGNLLSNAIKYTDSQGQIAVDVRDEGKVVHIEVTDSGSGISPELLPRVFELFVQSHRTLDRSQGGLGVGLAVVKRLIDMHGGHVQAFSRGEGLGSSFQIRLPRIAKPSAAVEKPVVGELMPRRILIVDDNVDAADSLVALLKMQGHVLMAVHTAREALASIDLFKPDVMLIDIGLPDMDGYALVKQLGGSPFGQKSMKIAVTGYGQPGDRKRALDVGFDEHLVKPVAVDAIEQAIAGLR
ncbi:response regulator [Massilia dura]|uniref:histidine kinase n=1 Tax=Pseudoduganella dura TaxID=321982 RepID=A0A6I3X3S9_9BURK|nr:ATP-binding protein [Pseudoduganella dura]MUI11524.1 response regulator [Pseudoduganella dura]GGX97130.1 hypothetical protein GCM10007386_30030 [Pseudoduganella dura]